MIVIARSPNEAIKKTIEHLHYQYDLTLRSLELVDVGNAYLPRGEQHWVVQEAPELNRRKAGVVPWEAFERTHWIALYH